MNFKILQLVKIASVISLPVILSDAQAQEFEPNLGETYFKADQMVSFELGPDKPDFEEVIKPNFGILRWSSFLGHESGLSLELRDSLELQRSKNELRSFALSTKDFEIPLSLALPHSVLLLARWDKDFLSNATTELLPKHDLTCERPSNDHFELVWTSTGFELNCYQSEKISGGRCYYSPPPARQTKVIRLTVQSYGSHGSNLILVPKQHPRLLPLFVILSDHGTVRTAMSPDADLLFPPSNLDNNNSTTWNSEYFSATTVVD